ncbi:MAG: Hpt domain-containing protein [Coriobacteriia bacterium]|nr:Hpt domain-containing protein [Coriobacteriia bacterium]
MTPEELYQQAGGDYAEAKMRLMNDSMISRFVVKFLDDPTFAQLKEGWDAQDAGVIGTASHTLKGVAGNLALSTLYQSSMELCEMYRNGAPDDLDLAKATYERVCADHERAFAAISAFRDQQ